MRYLIIGLGIFGANLARNLSDLGHEVIGVDSNHANIEDIKDYISTVYQIDSTEEHALEVLPLLNVDLVIVAIGENFGASIRTVALLKKAGVKHIYARATDNIHESILEGFGIDRILTPEQRAASDLAIEMELGAEIQMMPIDADTTIVKLPLPTEFEGKDYRSMDFENEYGVVLVAASRPEDKTNILGIAQSTLEPLLLSDNSGQRGDVITIIGARKKVREFAKANSIS